MVQEFFLRPPRSGLPVHRSIYSRSQRQGGEEFKEAWKIAQRVDAERARAGRSGFFIKDVWDIVALTVVYNYDSECELAAAYAKANGGHIFEIIHHEQRTANGYYAHHLVANCKKAACFGRLCEIQLKTVLHDAWANKTHDLTYKPLDQLDPRIQQQMQLIGGILQGVEKQSEILRSLIEEQWEEDSERRSAARRALIGI